MAQIDFENTISLSIPFQTSEKALLVYDVLSVDKEFKGSKVKKVISVDNNSISVVLSSFDLKILRVALNGFLKNVILIVKTIIQFEEC